MSSSNSIMISKSNKDKAPEFPVNKKLIEFNEINITSPNKSIEQEYNQKELNQDITDTNKKTSENVINNLKNKICSKKQYPILKIALKQKTLPNPH